MKSLMFHVCVIQLAWTLEIDDRVLLAHIATLESKNQELAFDFQRKWGSKRRM